MAAGILQPPGLEHGPCAVPCNHIDCAKTREMAATQCHMCGKLIGYETRFYSRGNTFAHAVCLEDSIYAIGKGNPLKEKP